MFLLNPPRERSEDEKRNKSRFPQRAVRSRHSCLDSSFFMGMTNSRIVRAARALFEPMQQAYDSEFGYQEFQKLKSGLRAKGLLLSLGMFQLTMRNGLDAVF